MKEIHKNRNTHANLGISGGDETPFNIQRATCVGRLRRLNRRQRKKLKVAEFLEFTFEVRAQFREPLSEAAYDQFLDAFIDFIEKRLLAFGGMSWRLPLAKIDGVISAWGRGSPSEDDRQSVLAWLQGLPDIALAEVGVLSDTESMHITPVGGNVFLDLGFEPDEAAALQAETKRVVSEKRQSRQKKIASLLDGITPDNLHEETDWGRPVGRELK